MIIAHSVQNKGKNRQKISGKFCIILLDFMLQLHISGHDIDIKSFKLIHITNSNLCMSTNNMQKNTLLIEEYLS